jgi:mRNA interferase RelE/StbE
LIPLRIEFLPSAAKDFRSAPPRLQPRLLRALDIVAQDPREGKPLQGPYHGLFSYRVGDYRIVYKPDLQARTLLVCRLGHRRDIYR